MSNDTTSFPEVIIYISTKALLHEGRREGRKEEKKEGRKEGKEKEQSFNIYKIKCFCFFFFTFYFEIKDAILGGNMFF